VGQGQSVLLEFAGAAVLVDAGGDAGNARRDHLRDYLDAFFTRRADLNRTLAAVIVTHPHIDHTRFLMDVLGGYTVRELVDGGRNQNASGIAQVRQARTWAAQHGIVYNKVPDVRIGAGGYQPSMLRALKTGSSRADVRFINGSTRCGDENNNSLAVLVRYQAFTMLVPGDAEREDTDCTPAIRRMLSRFRATLLNVDVFVADHHGSANGVTTDYLTALSPRVSVISAGDTLLRDGPFNAFGYGHPREQAVGAIERATLDARTPVAVYTMDGQHLIHANRTISRAVYCTCWDGDVVVDVDATGSGVSVRTTP
jgi:competence protein ComEC